MKCLSILAKPEVISLLKIALIKAIKKMQKGKINTRDVVFLKFKRLKKRRLYVNAIIRATLPRLI